MSSSPRMADARRGAGAELNARLAGALNARYRGDDADGLLAGVLREDFAGRVAVVSSFGAESAVILSLVARVDPAVPVIFLDTGKHFPETLAYRDALVARLGLRDVRSVRPDRAALAAADPEGSLSRRQPDRCCHLRKVLPLRRALEGFAAWITGRKRYHGAARAALPCFEAVDGRIKINPLAAWSAEDVAAAHEAGDLPPHPLVASGYLSIGCAPCTRPGGDRAAPRAGRWAALDKTECGIHWPAAGAGLGG